MASERVDVVVVGAGLAGLRCARDLARTGLEVALHEASDGVGGRVRTDRHDGFTFDRGFQVLNDAYPEARAVWDLGALDLQRMDNAVVVRRGGRLHRVGNPLTDPREAPGLLTTGLLPLGQKIRLGAYAAAAATLPVSMLLGRDDLVATAAWKRSGITQETIEAVLEPFFTGVVLDTELGTSRRFLDLMMRMFARGHSTVPAAGMQALAEQLAAAIPAGALRLHSPVASVHPGGVVLAAGGEVDARAVVVATDAWTACSLLPALGAPPAARGVTTVYHAAPVWPGQRSTLVADADGSAVANSIVVSAGAASYAPPGRALVATSLVQTDGVVPDGGAEDRAVLPVLAELFEQDTSGWERLRTYDIPHALPAMTPPHDFRSPVRLGEGLYVAGDHRDTSSLQGALVSGRRARVAVLADLA